FSSIASMLQRPALTNWGFALDLTGRLQNIVAGLLPIEDASATPDPTLVSIEVAPEDLPEGIRAEQISIARLDGESGRVVAIETTVVPLEDGRFGLLAWPDQSGIYRVLVRPVAERTLHAGVTAVAWYGAEGQPPARAILGADADIEALWVL